MTKRLFALLSLAAANIIAAWAVVLPGAFLGLPWPGPEAIHPWKPQIVIVVAIDTCRADHIGAYGYGRPTTPNLDRLAAQGVLFERAYSQSNESLFSYASLLTGRYSRQVSQLSHVGFQVGHTVPTLASMLAASGVQTAAYVGGGHLSHQFGFARGFDRYEDTWPFGSFFHTIPRAIERIRETARSPAPLFMFVQGYDVHEPYHKPMMFDHLFDRSYTGVAEAIVSARSGSELIYHDRWYRVLPAEAMMELALRGPDVADPMLILSDLQRAGRPSVPLARSDVEHVINSYDGALTYADVWLGLLAAAIEGQGLTDRTLLVVLGDHGEELGEHGFFGHRMNLSEPSLHVPLVVWAPGHVPAASRVSRVVELRDVMPTVLDYFGVDALGDGASSLRPLIEGKKSGEVGGVAISEALMRQVSIRNQGWRLAYKGTDGPDSEVLHSLGNTPLDRRHFALYDLRVDPGERENRLEQQPELAARLRDELVTRLRARPAP